MTVLQLQSQLIFFSSADPRCTKRQRARVCNYSCRILAVVSLFTVFIHLFSYYYMHDDIDA